MAEKVGHRSLVDRIRATDLKADVDKAAGSNRRVLLAHRVDLEAALAHGYSLRRLHTQLRAEGIVATDYSSFRRAARTAGLGVKETTLASQPHTPAEKPKFVFERPEDEPREFVHNPRPKREPWG